MARQGKGVSAARQRPESRIEIVDEAGQILGLTMMDDESALAWLFRRKGADGAPLISAEQFAAGERLRRDFTTGSLSPRVTASWNWAGGAGRVDQSGRQGSDPTERAMAARSRFHAALDAVGPELSGILWEVCCLASGVEQAERRLALPSRSGKAVLGLALTRLARHYGLIAKAQAPRADGPTRAWNAADSRPEIL